MSLTESIPRLGKPPGTRETQRWETGADGASRWFPRGSEPFVIRRAAGRWRLSHGGRAGGDQGLGTDRWEAVEIDDCRAVASFIRDHGLRARAWEAGLSDVSRALPEHGLTLRARRDGPGFFKVEAVEDATGKVPGTLQGGFSGWETAFALARDTANGHVRLHEGFRGRGIASAMYDLAEAFGGLPMVPHGRHFVRGTVSPMGEEFWRKRAARRPPPGHGDPSAETRGRSIHDAREIFRIEIKDLCPMRAVALARACGGTLDVMFETIGNSRHLLYAVVRMPDGHLLGGKGLVDTSPFDRGGGMGPVVELDADEAAAILFESNRGRAEGVMDGVWEAAKREAAEVMARHLGPGYPVAPMGEFRPMAVPSP